MDENLQKGKDKYWFAVTIAILVLMTPEGGELLLLWFQKPTEMQDMPTAWASPELMDRLSIRIWGICAGLMVALGAIWLSAE